MTLERQNQYPSLAALRLTGRGRARQESIRRSRGIMRLKRSGIRIPASRCSSFTTAWRYPIPAAPRRAFNTSQRWSVRIRDVSNIVTVAARKGGVGKTTLAYELAWLLDAPLVDLEFDEGSATRVWGYRHEDRVRAPLLDALESGRTPRPLSGYHKPDLVPCHPDFQLNQPAADDMADALSRWAGEWQRDFVVVDTHGGGSPSGDGAIAAASVVVVPVPLKTKDLNATEGMVREMPDYPLVILPNMVPRVPSAAEIDRVAQIVAGTPVPVAEPVPYVRGIETRKKRVAITSEDPTPKAYQPFVAAIHSLAGFVKAQRP